MRVLVACEFSGVVRRAFAARGHDAWSCDLLPADDGSPRHRQRDIIDLLTTSAVWDLIIAHPPCTALAVSGNRWHTGTPGRAEAARFVTDIANMMTRCSSRWAIENPVSALSTLWRKPDQIIHPWQFGHGECKTTCLWLHGLPRLRPTCIVEGRGQTIHRMPPGPNRWMERSRTFTGIAEAMADQWHETATAPVQLSMGLLA